MNSRMKFRSQTRSTKVTFCCLLLTDIPTIGRAAKIYIQRRIVFFFTSSFLLNKFRYKTVVLISSCTFMCTLECIPEHDLFGFPLNNIVVFGVYSSPCQLRKMQLHVVIISAGRFLSIIWPGLHVRWSAAPSDEICDPFARLKTIWSNLRWFKTLQSLHQTDLRV